MLEILESRTDVDLNITRHHLFLLLPYVSSELILSSLSLETVRGMISIMEPVSTVTSAWTIAKTAGEISKKLYELGKTIKDRDTKRQVDEITDELRELKHKASLLEDENRELREELRFKSDDYDFRTPFWYDKAHPDRALCAKCFAKGTPAPMGEQGHSCSPEYRRCLVCSDIVRVTQEVHRIGEAPIMRTDWPQR